MDQALLDKLLRGEEVAFSEEGGITTRIRFTGEDLDISWVEAANGGGLINLRVARGTPKFNAWARAIWGNEPQPGSSLAIARDVLTTFLERPDIAAKYVRWPGGKRAA